MINIEYLKYPPASIDDTRDKKLKAHLKSIPALIDEFKDKKFSEFEESVRECRDDKNYKLTNLLLKRHFLIKAVQEVNKELIKKKKIFRLDFSYDACLLFHNQTELYWEKEGYYNDDGTIFKFCVNQYHYILELIIKKHSNHKKFIICPKELETNLPVLYVDVYIKKLNN